MSDRRAVMARKDTHSKAHWVAVNSGAYPDGATLTDEANGRTLCAPHQFCTGWTVTSDVRDDEVCRRCE